MKGRLLEASESVTISPLVDVVFNAMAAIFIFLVIYILVVQPKEPPPLVIHSQSLPDAVAYRDYESGISVSGGEGGYSFEVVSGSFPPGVELDEVGGHVRGNPQVATRADGAAETFEVRIRVEDAEGQLAERVLSWNVLPTSYPFDPEQHPLRAQVGRDQLPDAYVGEAYEYVVGMFGGIEPYVVSLSPDAPAWMAVSEGRLAGIPSEPGKYEFKLILQDSQDSFGVLERQGVRPRHEQDLRLTVRRRRPLEANVVIPSVVRVQERIVGGVIATGGRPPYLMTLNEATLPPGLVLDPESEVIAGTPEETGTFSIEVQVEDSSGVVADVARRITVLPERREFGIHRAALPAARVGAGYSFVLSAFGGDEPFRWRVVPEAPLPQGLSLEGPLVSGRPSSVEVRTFGVEVTDALGRTARASFELVVDPAPRSLEFHR